MRGRQRGVVREDFSKIMMFKLSPSWPEEPALSESREKTSWEGGGGSEGPSDGHELPCVPEEEEGGWCGPEAWCAVNEAKGWARAWPDPPSLSSFFSPRLLPASW